MGEHMVKLLANPKQKAKIVAENAHLNEARSAQQAKLEKVEEQLIELEVKRASEEIIEAAYERSKPVLDARRAKLLSGLKELSPEARIDDYNADATWNGPDITDDERRVLLRRYKVRIEVLAKQPGTRRFDPERVTFP